MFGFFYIEEIGLKIYRGVFVIYFWIFRWFAVKIEGLNISVSGKTRLRCSLHFGVTLLQPFLINIVEKPTNKKSAEGNRNQL
jgi:hypothetical protein